MEKKTRHFERLKVISDSIMTVPGQRGARAEAKILDLSFQGARIRTPLDIEKNTPVKLNISNPGGPGFNIKGRIIWRKSGPVSDVYGVEFTGFGFFQKKRWGKFIAGKFKDVFCAQQSGLRDAPRMSVAVSVLMAKEPEEEKSRGFISDISLGGMNLSATKELSLGDSVVFDFPIDRELNFCIRGDVVRKQSLERSYNYGICFRPESDIEKTRLRAFIFLKG